MAVSEETGFIREGFDGFINGHGGGVSKGTADGVSDGYDGF